LGFSAAYQKYAAWYTSHAQLLAALKQPALPVTEEEWMSKHPTGFLEYRDAMSPEGKYGTAEYLDGQEVLFEEKPLQSAGTEH